MNTPTDTRLAAAVRAAAKDRHLTHRDLARTLGLSRSAFTDRLSGRSRFTVAELVTLAEFLGMPVSALIDGTPQAVTR